MASPSSCTWSSSLVPRLIESDRSRPPSARDGWLQLLSRSLPLTGSYHRARCLSPMKHLCPLFPFPKTPVSSPLFLPLHRLSSPLLRPLFLRRRRPKARVSGPHMGAGPGTPTPRALHGGPSGALPGAAPGRHCLRQRLPLRIPPLVSSFPEMNPCPCNPVNSTSSMPPLLTPLFLCHSSDTTSRKFLSKHQPLSMQLVNCNF